MKKNKIYELIGRAVTYVAGYVGILAISVNLLSYIVTNCITTIR